MCVAIFTKLGVRFPNSIDSCLSTCFTEKNGNLVGTSWIGFVFFVFLMELDMKFPKTSGLQICGKL